MDKELQVKCSQNYQLFMLIQSTKVLYLILRVLGHTFA